MKPKRTTAAEQRVVRAAMRWYESYRLVGIDWAHLHVPLVRERALSSACQALSRARSRKARA